MTSVLYFLHLNTLDILLLIVQQFFVVVKVTKRRKNQSEAYFNLLFIYFITVNKYRFCISVIGYINMQIIGIGYKKINIGRSLIMNKRSSSDVNRMFVHS